MSADKHKLHDRAMKFLRTEIRQGRVYKVEYGIGDSRELDYLLKKKLVKIIRYEVGSQRGGSKHRNVVEPVKGLS